MGKSGAASRTRARVSRPWASGSERSSRTRSKGFSFYDCSASWRQTTCSAVKECSAPDSARSANRTRPASPWLSSTTSTLVSRASIKFPLSMLRTRLQPHTISKHCRWPVNFLYITPLMDSNSPVATPVNSVTVTIVYIAALIWRLTARHSENRRRFRWPPAGVLPIAAKTSQSRRWFQTASVNQRAWSHNSLHAIHMPRRCLTAQWICLERRLGWL